MNRLYRSILAAFLLVAILMTASGCGGGDTQSTGKTKLPMQTEGNETNQPETTEPSQPEQGLIVEQLRQQMSAENKAFAVAYLGYMTYDYETVWEFIDILGEPVLQELPFLNQIPETNIITNASQGEVYCFIPADPEAVIEVFTYATGEEVFYEGCGEDPYLLVCNSAESPDCYVTITDIVDGEDFTMYWYPKLDEYLYVEQPRYAEGTTGPLDISPYNAMLLTYYEDVQADGDWEIPTKADLENTTWYWDGYLLDGSYYEYRVTFHEDTADVRWNPGYDETTEYTDAQWDYEDDDISVLTIDFGEFAGVRKYNLLIDWKANMMYIATDATAKDLTWDSEPLYRFLLLEQTDGTQPMDLVGTWERILTEVEGDVTETPAGQVIVTITGTGEANLQITYKDKEFPDSNYSQKAMTIVPGGDNMGFSGAEWIAEVDHVGNYGTTYALAIVDGQLVIRNYFEVDGAPGVSYETFQRVG